MPKAIDHDQRRREIIDATWGLIVRGGLEAATMREIASEAGFANGALKHYFPGKDEIIEGAYERALTQTRDRVAALVGEKTGIEALKASVYGSMPMDDEAYESARVLLSFWERGVSNGDLRGDYQDHLDSWHAQLESLIADCRAEGSIRTSASDAELVKEIILMNMGATVMTVIGPQFATAPMLERQLDAFFERIARP